MPDSRGFAQGGRKGDRKLWSPRRTKPSKDGSGPGRSAPDLPWSGDDSKSGDRHRQRYSEDRQHGEHDWSQPQRDRGSLQAERRTLEARNQRGPRRDRGFGRRDSKTRSKTKLEVSA